jgi:serine/threonine protein kinase
MTGAVAELSGTMMAGSYRLVRALGGDDGHVHEARHDRLPDRFAVKLFGEVEPRAFQRGAQQASALRHPGIVKVVDYGAAPGRAFVVMEWVEGRSLATILAEDGPLAPDAVARIIDSIALGLQAAHRQGLAHGHLAPERILMLSSGVRDALDGVSGVERTKILGFGFGAGDALTPALSITEVTPYTAPEQLANDASPLGDQFALGAIAYELLTGEPPVVDAHLRHAPRSIREYDPTINVIVDDVVQRAVSLDPGARWADVYTFAKRLRETIDAEGLLEEKTRLAPLPLTVTRPASASMAAERSTGRSTERSPQTPTPINLPPVIASIDVDLRTPAPRRLELPTIKPVFMMPLQGEISMNPPPSRPPAPRAPIRMPGQLPTPRFAPDPNPPHYGIRPTATFSFTDEPVPGPLYKPRRAGRGRGGLGLLVVVLAAGVGGYFAVQTPGVWHEVEPLMARGKELARSLRTLVPGATPEAPPPPVAPGASPKTTTTNPTTTAQGAATGPTPTTPSPAATTAPAVTNVAAEAPAPPSHPEVVQIPPEAPPAEKRPQPHHASRAHHAREHAPKSVSGRASKPKSPAFDEAAAEEALLAAP